MVEAKPTWLRRHRRIVLALSAVMMLATSAWALTLATQRIRASANRLSDMWNLKQLSLAVANYHDANGHLPPAYILGPDGRPWHSWRVLILPYIEQDELHKAYNFAEPWDGPNNRKLASRMPRSFAFHGTEQPGNMTTNYVAVVGKETAWPGSTFVNFADIKDGMSTTIMLVENRGANIHWMEPRDLSLADMDLQVDSPNGVSSTYKDPAVVTLDGSVRRLRPNMKPSVLRGLLTIRGGEQVVERNGSWELLVDGRDRPLREP